MMPKDSPRYSLIIPVYKNEMNIEDLLAVLAGLHSRWPDMEVVFVVDASPDSCWDILRERLPRQLFASQLILLSRNFGSFAAIRTGLEVARGQFLAVMAADQQEPPDLISCFFIKLSADECDVVIGRRSGREDKSPLSNLYWKIYRSLIVPEIPPGGVDIFGCTRQVAAELLNLREANSSLVAQLFWVGYRRAYVSYDRRAREKGNSAWTFRKKTAYFFNSVVSFSDLPLHCLLWLGGCSLGLSGLIALVTLVSKLLGLIPVSGYTTLILMIMLGFSTMILSQAILGFYLWRCFENTKGRPLALIRRSDIFNGSKSTMKRPPNTP